MNKRHRKLAWNVGVGTAEHLFEMMQNPKFRGPKFTWAGFPDMVAGLAGVQVALPITNWDDWTAEDRKRIENMASESAIYRARELLKIQGD